MTPLMAIIRRRIEEAGPMSLAEYMALCLGHPEHGYYVTRDPLGAAGDFTTAPEISQMFGEMIGLALAQAWIDRGRPERFVLAELGPGRGALMADLLRAARAAPGFVEAAEIWLVETSPRLRAEQAKRVPGARWAAGVEELPAGPLLLIANEFFDALPITQHVREGGLWRERVVGLRDGRLAFGLAKPTPGPEAPEGAVRERSAAGEAVAGWIGARVAAEGGAAIIVDYGYEAAPPEGGDTFQAVARHAYAEPLAAPGEADLTAHVDFAALAAAARARGGACSPVVAQGEWLARLGIGRRAEALARARPDRAETVAAALERLTSAHQMGTLFKALAIHDGRPPPGFDP